MSSLIYFQMEPTQTSNRKTFRVLSYVALKWAPGESEKIISSGERSKEGSLTLPHWLRSSYSSVLLL